MEFADVTVKESPGLCRCCLSEGCYKDLGTEYAWMNDTEVYADMLLDCFDIGITQHNDGPNGPKRLICEVCITRLRDACNFKKQVVDSEKKFIDMLGRGEFRHLEKQTVMLPMYTPAPPMKAETLEEATVNEDYDDSHVEFLDDNDFTEDEEQVKIEGPSNPVPVASTSTVKRGRPKKSDSQIPEKKPKLKGKSKMPKVSEIEDASSLVNSVMEKMTELQRKEDLVSLMSTIIENSTAVPFRWHCSKFACFFCCYPFEESSKLKAHYHEEHSDAKIRSAFRGVIKNSKVKLEISNLTCKKCSKCFNIIDELLDHFVKIHAFKLNLEVKHQVFAYKLADDRMPCLQCGDEFRFFGTLLKHTHAKHNTTNEAFLCEICGQAFVTKTSVASHVKTVHTNDGVSCDKCNISFKNVNALQLHHRRTHRTYMLKCPKCPEVLTSPYLRKRHLAKVHDVKRFQYECDLCNFVFTLKSRLLMHKSRVHMKERAFGCEFCSYKAFNKESLTRHMVSHDDTRPFQCEFCKKAFQRKKTLELHRRIHTNDRRYGCKECGKAFVQYTSLKLHYRVHHSKEGPTAEAHVASYWSPRH